MTKLADALERLRTELDDKDMRALDAYTERAEKWSSQADADELIAELIDYIGRLREALRELAQYAADEIGVPLEECVSGPIGDARRWLTP